MYDIKNCLQGPICIIRFLFCLRKYFRIISERNGFILDQSALRDTLGVVLSRNYNGF